MSPRSSQRRAGFTLLEVLIASVVGLVIVTAVMTFVMATDRAHQRRVRLAALRRSAARVMDQLSAELRQAGNGVPVASGYEGTTAAFPSRTLVQATTTSVGFLADIARPDTSLNGFSTLVDDQTTAMPASSVALLNELNGSCDVSLGGSMHCETGLSTLLLPRAAGGCHLSGADPTCPWGLNRYRANEFVLVSDRNGRWVERRVTGAVFTSSASRRTLSLNAAPPAALLGRARGGFLSTVDRVFYRANAGALERHQCWDTVGTPTIGTLGPCVGGNGTPWEELVALDAGSTLTFTYFDAAGAPIAAPVPNGSLPAIARIDIALRLVRTVNGEQLILDSNHSVSLRQ